MAGERPGGAGFAAACTEALEATKALKCAQWRGALPRLEWLRHRHWGPIEDEAGGAVRDDAFPRPGAREGLQGGAAFLPGLKAPSRSGERPPSAYPQVLLPQRRRRGGSRQGSGDQNRCRAGGASQRARRSIRPWPFQGSAMLQQMSGRQKRRLRGRRFGWCGGGCVEERTGIADGSSRSA
eukprot:scaffold79_cov259-Pinguiococcus_pyrenoidosus.AAC.20